MAIGPDQRDRRRPAALTLASLALGATLALAGGSAALAAERIGPAGRYDGQLFVCRSLDPSDSRLNLRSAPAGPILDTISRRERFYVRGRELRLAPAGWVPVHAQPPANATSAAMGWVWKAYISCELIDRIPAGGDQGGGQLPRPQST